VKEKRAKEKVIYQRKRAFKIKEGGVQGKHKKGRRVCGGVGRKRGGRGSEVKRRWRGREGEKRMGGKLARKTQIKRRWGQREIVVK